jgi:predicted RNA-binding protein YlxR (DUF448 family)
VKRPQAALVRLRLVDATLVVDLGERGPGRGAYLCPRRDCVERARARDAAILRRALQGPRARTERPGRLDVAALDALQARSATQQGSLATDGAQTP